MVLNKYGRRYRKQYGRRYRKRAAGNLESSLSHLPERLLRKPAEKVRQGEIQDLIEELALVKGGKG